VILEEFQIWYRVSGQPAFFPGPPDQAAGESAAEVGEGGDDAAVEQLFAEEDELDDEVTGDVEADWQAEVEDFAAEDEHACIDEPAEG